MKPLKNKIALVAGATRGAGRGIACMLGEAGAVVYCTGRSVKGSPASGKGRPETIEETAEMVTAKGGKGIYVQTDHTNEEQVKALFERVKKDYGGLDILVNDIWGGDELIEWGKSFWEFTLKESMKLIEQTVYSHILTSRYGVPLMIKNKNGLVVEVTDATSFAYKESLLYDLIKFSVIRLAFGMSEELREHNIASVAVSPGFLRSEAMLEHFGVTENNWIEGAKKDKHFVESETPFYIGKAIASLAADPNIMKKTGKTFYSGELALEYGFKDVDGRQPNWKKYFKENEDLKEIREYYSQTNNKFLDIFNHSEK